MVHFIISTWPQTKTQKRLVNHIYWKWLPLYPVKCILLAFVASLKFSLNDSSTFVSHCPPSSCTWPEVNTKPLVSIVDAVNLPVAKSLWGLFSYGNDSLINSFPKSTSLSVGVDLLFKYLDFTDFSYASVSGTFSQHYEAILCTKSINISIVVVQKYVSVIQQRWLLNTSADSYQ